MIKISNYLLLSLTLLVILVSQLGMHGNLTPLFTGVGIISFISISLFLIIINKKLIIKKVQIANSLYIYFFGLILFSLISYLVTGRLKAIIVYSSLILLFFAVRVFSTIIINKDRFIINLVFGACLTGFLVILLGLDEPFTFFRYKGFYTNSNSMGMLTASLIHMIIGILYSYKNLTRFKKFFFYILFLISSVFLLASNSRAAMLSVLIVLLLMPTIEGYKSIKFFKLKTKYLKKFFKYTVLITLFLSIIYFLGLLDNTIDKFEMKTQAGDVSDGRVEGWIVMLQNWTWFGHRNFEVLTDKSIIFGHNTWLSHLNYYGLLAVLFFLGWIVSMLKWAWKNITNKDQPKHEVIFLFVLIGFIINATFETATSTPGFLLSIVLFGIVYRKNALYISQR